MPVMCLKFQRRQPGQKVSRIDIVNVLDLDSSRQEVNDGLGPIL